MATPTARLANLAQQIAGATPTAATIAEDPTPADDGLPLLSPEQ